MGVFTEIIKSIFIGIVQGITEWLPISSTGHMILFDEFIKLDVSKQFLDMFLVVVQLGSILAVLYLYFRKLNPFSSKKTLNQKRETIVLWLKVLIGCLPAAIVGFLFDDLIHDCLYGPITVALTLIIYGILFIVVENRKKTCTIKRLSDLDYKTAFLIGIFQVLALIPGTSRSGATIIGASILGTSRQVAAEYSFFLAIPVMFGASGFKILKYIKNTGFYFSASELSILISGMAVAFIVSVFAIKFLISYIKHNDFKAFGYYRIILGAIVLIYFLFFDIN